MVAVCDRELINGFGCESTSFFVLVRHRVDRTILISKIFMLVRIDVFYKSQIEEYGVIL